MKTVIQSYQFDTTKAADKAAYAELCARLTAQGSECFCTWGGGGSHYLPAFKEPRTIELETKHLFNNQWNTAPIEGVSEQGLRVFDWAEDYPIGAMRKSLKRGHYLTITAEMREARRNTNACGYCGHQEAAQKGAVFCPKCIGSEYLKAGELHLTRMQAIDCKIERAPLTDAERAHLAPIYKDAQLHGHTERDKKRIAETRADIESTYAKKLQSADAEYKGFTWLMDHGIRPDIAIYYTHTGRFGFGWRSPLDADTVSALLDVISEFPYAYDIECADGRTLAGG